LTPAANQTGTSTITLSVSDGQATTSTSFVLTVTPVNDAPAATRAILDQIATEDAAFNFVVPAHTFADADAGDTLRYTAAKGDGSALPTWLTFDATTRTFSGTPANADVGTLDIQVAASDAAGAVASATFRLTVVDVNDAPTLSLAPIVVESGGSALLSIQVADIDSAPSAMSFQVEGLQGGRIESTQAPGAAITAFTAEQWQAGQVRFVHAFGATQAGFTLRVSDGAATASVQAQITVKPVVPAVVPEQVVPLSVPAAGAAPTTPTVSVTAPAPAPVVATAAPAPVAVQTVTPAPAPSPAASPAPAASVSSAAPSTSPAPAADIFTPAATAAPTPAGAALSAPAPSPSPGPSTVSLAPAQAPAPPASTSSESTPPAAAPATSASPATTTATPAGGQNAAPGAAAAPAAAAAPPAPGGANPGRPGPVAPGGPEGAPAATATAAPTRAESPVRVEVPANVPGAAAVNNFIRWVAAAAPGDAPAAPIQPSLTWAPINQVAIGNGAFDAALGLGGSSSFSSDATAAQIRLEGTFRQMKEDVEQEVVYEQGVAASSVVVTTTFSVGYVLWLARGGALLASLASAIPAWTSIDPLPVLSNFKTRTGKGPDGEDPPDPADNAGMPGSRKDQVEDMFGSEGRRNGAPARERAAAADSPARAAVQPAVGSPATADAIDP
ncbi:MAG: hypothetical protein RI988_3779, partial [Pseudomonadota bacterium]